MSKTKALGDSADYLTTSPTLPYLFQFQLPPNQKSVFQEIDLLLQQGNLRQCWANNGLSSPMVRLKCTRQKSTTSQSENDNDTVKQNHIPKHWSSLISELTSRVAHKTSSLFDNYAYSSPSPKVMFCCVKLKSDRTWMMQSYMGWDCLLFFQL